MQPLVTGLRAVSGQRTILLFDIEGFSGPGRNDRARAQVRDALHAAVTRMLGATGVVESDARFVGDGLLVLVSPRVSFARVLRGVFTHLPNEVAAYNGLAAAVAQLQLGVAVHAGARLFDPHGGTAEDLNLASRLLKLDWDRFKDYRPSLLNPVVVAVSDRIYQEVVRHWHHYDLGVGSCEPVEVSARELRLRAWLCAPRAPERPAGARRGGRLAAGAAPVIDTTPLPQPFLLRPELTTVKDAVIDAGNAATERERRVALAGVKGVGKTVLARALVEDREVHQAFPDGIVWLELGDEPDLSSRRSEVLRALGGEPAVVWSGVPGPSRFQWLLSGKRVLLVIDKVCHARQLDAFPAPEACAVLALTRYEKVLRGAGHFRQLKLDALSEEQALQLLAASMGYEDLGRLPRHARELVEVGGALPREVTVAAALAARTSAGRPSPATPTLRELTGSADPSHRQELLTGILVKDLEALPAWQQECLEHLCVFERRLPVPGTVIARSWRAHLPDGATATALLDDLAGWSLIRRGGSGEVSVHEVLLEHARDRLATSESKERLRRLHGRLADGYLRDWGGLDLGLPRLRGLTTWTDDDTYGLSNLVHHLVQACRLDLAQRLLAAEWRQEPHARTPEAVENAWYAAHERAGLLPRYLADLRQVHRLTKRAVDDELAGGGDGSPSIGLEVRYFLVNASLNSVAANLPPRLLSTLVGQGVWPHDQALAWVRRLASSQQRGSALAELSRFMPSPPPPSLLNETLTACGSIVDDQSRAEALAAVAAVLPRGEQEDVLTKALAAAASIADPGWRAAVLTTVAASMDRGAGPGTPVAGRERNGFAKLRGDLVATALGVAHQTADPWGQAEALAGLSAQLPPERRAGVVDEVLELVQRIDDRVWRARVVELAAPQLSRAQLQDALRLCRRIGDAGRRAEVLVAAAACLGGADGDAVLTEVLDAADGLPSDAGLGVLVAVAPRRPDQVLAAAQQLAPADRLRVLAALLPHQPPRRRSELLDEILATVDHLPDPKDRAAALTAAAPYLPARSIAAAQKLPDRLGLVGVLVAAAPLQPDQVLAAAGDLAPPDRLRVLAALLPHRPPRQRRRLLREILRTVDTVPDPRDRATTLTALLPHRRPRQRRKLLDEILATVDTLAAPSDRAAALRAIANLDDAAVTPDWAARWRPLLRDAAASGREELLLVLPTMLPVIARYGGTPAIRELIRALDDVGRWWP